MKSLLEFDEGAMKYVVMWFRLLFGAHLIYSGMRHVLGIEVLANVTHPVGGTFVRVLAEMGMYQFVKYVELAVGLLLFFNRLVPLALIVELPITAIIFWLNTLVVAGPRQVFSGPQELFLNSIMILFYARYYLPLLNWRAPARPLWQTMPGDVSIPPLPGQARNQGDL